MKTTLADRYKTISPGDPDLFHIIDSPEEVVRVIDEFYSSRCCVLTLIHEQTLTPDCCAGLLCSSPQPIPLQCDGAQRILTCLWTTPSLGIEVDWDDPEVQIPLDFSIDSMEQLGGILMLGGTGEMLMNTTENGLLNILWPISLDIMDIERVEAEEFSSIQYQVTGESPNRILKVSGTIAGFYDEISSLGTHC